MNVDSEEDSDNSDFISIAYIYYLQAVLIIPSFILPTRPDYIQIMYNLATDVKKFHYIYVLGAGKKVTTRFAFDSRRPTPPRYLVRMF